MKNNLKSIEEQVVVLTGATSGIGLATARLMAREGTKLVIAARGARALRKLTDELGALGGQVAYKVADVGIESDVDALARFAIKTFGGIDTWVNNAGVSVYGEITEIETEDLRKVFETNFWGTVYGSRAAIPYLKRDGGALINVGSVLSDVAMPLQGIYSASKHAIKGFTDALRMELEAEEADVSVTLIKPAAIDTPYPRHAKNYFNTQPKNPSPLYPPSAVAEAIVHAAQYPKRDVIVGGAGVAMSAMGSSVIADKMMVATMNGQRSDKPAFNRQGALYAPSNELRESGDGEGVKFKRSFYTKASLHPVFSSAVAATALGAGFFFNRAIKKNSSDDRTLMPS